MIMAADQITSREGEGESKEALKLPVRTQRVPFDTGGQWGKNEFGSGDVGCEVWLGLHEDADGRKSEIQDWLVL